MKLSEEIVIRITVCEMQIKSAEQDKEKYKTDWFQGNAKARISSYTYMLEELKKFQAKAEQLEQQLDEYKTESQAYHALKKAL